MEDKNSKIFKEISDDKILVLNRAKRLCSVQEKCIFDIKKKLQNWEISEENYNIIINTLVKEGFINETRYATAFVNDKFRFAKWGKIKIAYALKGKKISDSDIYKALNTIDDTDYFLLVEKEIKKKLKIIKDSDKNKLKAKLFRFSQSKGFESDLSFQVINKLLKTD